MIFRNMSETDLKGAYMLSSFSFRISYEMRVGV